MLFCGEKLPWDGSQAMGHNVFACDAEATGVTCLHDITFIHVMPYFLTTFPGLFSHLSPWHHIHTCHASLPNCIPGLFFSPVSLPLHSYVSCLIAQPHSRFFFHTHLFAIAFIHVLPHCPTTSQVCLFWVFFHKKAKLPRRQMSSVSLALHSYMSCIVA